MMQRNWILILFLAFATMSLPSCGYNQIQVNDQKVTSAWSEVQNQYKRRYDLIPQLVKVVKAFAKQEREVLVAVTEARSRVGQVNLNAEDLNDPQALQKFQQAQGAMSSALSRLMLVVERYPELRSNQNFLDLQAQLEGTENRITVARNRYIKAVEAYNISVVTFPNNVTARIFGFQTKANFEPDNPEEISQPPEIDL